MSIFGDETITFEDSPEGQESDIAVETENEEQPNNELETEQSETEESESSPEGQGENLILGKFKNNGELARAYSELQKQFTQSRQQPTQQQQFQQPEQQQPDYTEVFWENFNNDPLKTMEFLVSNVVNQKTAPIYEQREQETLGKNIEALAKDYKQATTEEGMTAMFQKIGEIAQDLGNPKLAQNPSPRVLKMAAQELWGDSKAQLYTKAKEQGRLDAEASRQAKLGVTAIGVTKKPNEAPKSEADHIIDGMMAASGKRGLFG